ncbi:MAG TPA: hypothetical protein EYQ00_02690 [Dehalococcoidia bacterium]|jgi:phage baseplate assembly protein W|nr:hypothetical protein [Dehalococcoidia bacterium]
MAGISVKLPLYISETDAAYALNKTLKDTVKQNFKMLLLTIPGERMMDTAFGIGLQTFFFEPNTRGTQERISARIHEQIEKYMPFLDVTDVYVGDDSTPLLHITISYVLLPTAEQDVLTLSLPQNGI